MYRKGSPIALIRATDHRRRQAAKANFSLCPTKVARHSLSRPAGGSSHGLRHPSAEHRRSTVAAASPLPCHRRRQSRRSITGSALCLASPEAFYTNVCEHWRAVSARDAGRMVSRQDPGRMLRGLDPERAGSRTGRIPAGCCAGAARCGRHPALATRWRCRPADAAGARSCQKSRSQTGFFPPQGQGFGPSPSCQRHAAPPAPRRGMGRPGSVPPSQGSAAGLHFPARATALRSYHPALPPPRPPARLQNHCLTLPKHL